MKRISAIPGLLLLTLASGCFYEIRDEIAECKINMANHCAAKQAWFDTRGACRGMCCPHSFKDGFMSGYVAVADGGNACLPAVPNFSCCNHMWMDCFCCDSDKMSAWYDGYELGAMAAKEGGMCDSNRVITRTPQCSPVDYSMPGQTHLNEMQATPTLDTNPTIPPPAAELPPAVGGPQTSRWISKNFANLLAKR